MADPLSDPLSEPLELPAWTMSNRVVMAPLTRSRAQADGVPGPLAAEYYAQRAGAGLIVSEATNISPVARGYADTPGIYAPAHVRGWRQITDAVHDAGGLIVCQLWHTGRVSHESLHPPLSPVSPSGGEAQGCMAFVIGDDGVGRRVPASESVALDAEGIADTVADYASAAARAMDAGFDGVEIHGANGYLLHQFLASNINLRTDGYGGSAANRARLTLEVCQAVIAEVGADRVGLRLAPIFLGNGVNDADPHETYTTLCAALKDLDLAYLHLADSNVMGRGVTPRMDDLLAAIDGNYTGRIFLNGAYDAERARADLAAGRADAIAFGRAFLANPDLPTRLIAGAPLNDPIPRTFYGGGAEGYTDYPTWNPGT